MVLRQTRKQEDPPRVDAMGEPSDSPTAPTVSVARSVTDALRRWLRVLFTPTCWVQNSPYSPDLDRFICERLAGGARFVSINGYEAALDGLTLWVENHPYASFEFASVRPRRSTILRAGDRLAQDRIQQQLEKARAALAKAEGR